MKIHETKMVPLTQLVGADYNPRIMATAEMAKLKKSITEFGFVEPIVVRASDMLILGGHQRVTALKALLAEQKADATTFMVPAVMVDGIDDERAKLLNVALNKIHGEWDFEKLAVIFTDLTTVGEIDLTVSGFNDRELEDLLQLSVSPNWTPTAAPTEDIDIDAELRARARKFMFECKTDDDADVVRKALERHGMTSPVNAAQALVALARASLVEEA